MKSTLFISYSHSDDRTYQWVQRLGTFFDGLNEEMPIDVWDDTKIGVGSNWRNEIETAISRASAAVLLVGPGFLASKFIKEHELPVLIEAKTSSSLRLYPLVVAFCPWKHSILEPHQAFNDPNSPLESMEPAQQNYWLNKLVCNIADDMRSMLILPKKASTTPNTLRAAIVAMKDHLETTFLAFMSQASRRDNLMKAMQKRLHLTEQIEYEQFFFQHYEDMDKTECFEFKQIRAVTEGLLHDSNRAMLEIIEATPGIRDELPILSALRLHLALWLNKYDKVFAQSAKMCVLYVGVEDGVPFPIGVDPVVAEWLQTNPQ